MSREYDKFWNSAVDSDDSWAEHPRSLRARALNLVSSEDGPVLDLGCGKGDALKILHRRGIDACGFDISQRALIDAQRYGAAVKGDASLLPFVSSAFGAVLMLDSLEHMPDKRRVLQEVNRVLKNSGRVIMTVPLPRASDGKGDSRQPFDEPAEFREILYIGSDNFRLEKTFGVPLLPLFVSLEVLIPDAVKFRLFEAFPFLMDRARYALLILTRNPGK